MWIDSRLVNNSSEQQTPTREIEYGSEQFMELARKLASEGRQGTIALNLDTLLLVDGDRVLIKAPTN